MSSGTKIPLKIAQGLAQGVIDILSPHCTSIHVAGSVRRQKSDVGDIEVVCLPLMAKTGMFSDATVRTYGFSHAVGLLGTVIAGSIDFGRHIKILLPEGIQLDLFCPQSHDYGRIMAVRTGSADYSRQVLATGWAVKGWVGTDDGLRLKGQCTGKVDNRGKTKWIPLGIPNITKPPIFDTEESFFDFINVRWIEPKLREI